MRIGYLLEQDVEIRYPPFDGPANHVRHVVEELAKLGHDVHILARIDGQIWRSDDLTRFHPVVVPAMDQGPLRGGERAVRRIQYELQLPYAAAFESLRFALACRQTLAGYDVLYERMSWADYGGALASRWMHVPLVLENNGDHLADLEAKGIAPQGAQRRLSVSATAWAVRQASHVIASGDGWRDLFIDRWKVSPDRVTTVENGTELVRQLGRSQLRSFQDFAASQDAVRLVYLGGFLPWQGVDILIDALVVALDQGAPAQLLMIGAGPGFDEAVKRVRELSLDQAVTFAGQKSLPELAPLLASADVGLAPYCGWPEYSGLKILDYKAAGLAIIASGEHGQPATLRHGVTGWIVPPCDRSSLARAILRLVEDGELRRNIGRAARLEAEACHGWDHTARQLETVLRAAAEGVR